MEFPDLGQNCSVKTCNLLDFLPMKCDACSNVFCKNHLQYNNHSCQIGLEKNVQVPVCPLCNNPVPSKRGEQPDIAVSSHIDRDCQADPAIAKRKIYTNKCNVKGCKQKEMIKLDCSSCGWTYCLKHRHPNDHKCEEQASRFVKPKTAAGAAAIARAQNSKQSTLTKWFSSHGNNSNNTRKQATSMPQVSITTNGALSEDEALALALQQSLNEVKPKHVQEEEDRLLALALSRSNQNRTFTSPQNRENRDRTCSLS